MNYFELTREELRAIITGKRVYKRCPACSDGIEYVDDELGTLVHPDNAEELVQSQPDRYYKNPCEDCKGLGFIIAIHE